MNPIEVVFGAIERGLGSILAGIYAVVPSYGLAIIVLTLLIRAVLYPITARSTRSMHKMQQLQPHVKKLQAKFKGDRAALSEAQMALFKANKVSPISGCLPLVIQMPFLFAMFRVINGASGVAEIGMASTDFLPQGSALADALSGSTLANPGALSFLGLNLGLSPKQVFDIQDWTQMVLQIVVIGLIVLTGVYQQRQMQARRSATPNETPQAMQTVGKVMPIFFGVISIFWPAALNIYWLTSNAFQVGQQTLILRTSKDATDLVVPKLESKSSGKKKSDPKRAAKRSTDGPSRGRTTPKRVAPKRVTPKSSGARRRKQESDRPKPAPKRKPPKNKNAQAGSKAPKGATAQSGSGKGVGDKRKR